VSKAWITELWRWAAAEERFVPVSVTNGKVEVIFDHAGILRGGRFERLVQPVGMTVRR
jgi:hypothetical protein